MFKLRVEKVKMWILSLAVLSVSLLQRSAEATRSSVTLPSNLSDLILTNNQETNPVKFVKNARMFTTYTETVNSSTIYMFKFHYKSKLGPGAVRLFVESLESVASQPVLVVVSHEKGVLSWQLPLLVPRSIGAGGNRLSEYRSVNRTMCPIEDYAKSSASDSLKENQDFLLISISTASRINTEFSLLVYLQEDFKVGMNETRRFIVSPSAPQYFEFEFPDDVDVALITVDSYENSRICMTVSVQNISCPIADLDTNVEYEGIWQTADEKTGMTIQKRDFPVGLHIVFVVKPDDVDCSSTSRLTVDSGYGQEREKHVRFKITQKISKDEYLVATFGAFFMFVGAYFVVIIVSCLICVRKRRVPVERSLLDPGRASGQATSITCNNITSCRHRYDSMSSTSTLSSSADIRTRIPPHLLPSGSRMPPQPQSKHDDTSPQGDSDNKGYEANSSGIEVDVEEDGAPDHVHHHGDAEGEDKMNSADPPNLTARTSSPVGDDIGVVEDVVDEGSNVDLEEYDLLPDADLEKEVFRTKTFLYVSDLARKHESVLHRRSMMYHWNLLTISIFYGLPVAQLVITYQTVLHQTGNEDLCYYNFLCAHPLGLLSDFNHVYSNLGYVMLGGLFMVFVWRREYMYNKQKEENPDLATMYGIPQHSGLFYAMALALVMEGLMSGCYHICPNHSNFQFDTAFMYTISILCMLKIYQFRHPDINANAYTAFGVLAFVIFIGVLGVMNSTIPFWIFFTGCHVTTCMIVSIQIYYLGRWRVNAGLVKRVWLVLYNDMCSLVMGHWRALKPTYPGRLFLLVLFNLINWALSIFGILVVAKQDGDFASFLLGVFIVNLLLYTLFYIIGKLRYGERICRQPLTYILLAGLCWAPAMYFFLSKSTTWILSPAQSRHYNQSCRLFHFYDNHDIWHFLSASALFFSFMILLTIDDDLAEKPRDKIPVF